MSETLADSFYKGIKAAIALAIHDHAMTAERAQIDLRYALARHLAEQTVIGVQLGATKKLSITRTVRELLHEMQQFPELCFDKEVFVKLVDGQGGRIVE